MWVQGYRLTQTIFPNMIGVGSPYNPHPGPLCCAAQFWVPTKIEVCDLWHGQRRRACLGCYKCWGLPSLVRLSLAIVTGKNDHVLFSTRRPGWRGKAGTQAWGSYSPVSWQKKYTLFAVRKWGKRRKGKGSKIEDDFWAGHLVGAFTLPYQIARSSHGVVWKMIYDVIEWDMATVWHGMDMDMVWIWIWYGYGSSASKMEGIVFCNRHIPKKGENRLMARWRSWDRGFSVP